MREMLFCAIQDSLGKSNAPSTATSLIRARVIDWDTTKLSPAPSAIHHPLFFADISGWRNDDVPEGMTFEEDQAYLEYATGLLDARLESPLQLQDLLRTSFERQFLELPLHNQRVNEQYIKRRFNPRRWSRKSALDQLDDFLSTHESMYALPAVLELRKTLNQLAR